MSQVSPSRPSCSFVAPRSATQALRLHPFWQRTFQLLHCIAECQALCPMNSINLT
jgi:hypothetical protein